MGTGTDVYGLAAWLYTDPAEYNWEPSTPEENELEATHDTYTLKVECNITSIDGNDFTDDRTGFGCCLRDAQGLSNGGFDRDEARNGGYCIRINSAYDGLVTAHLTESDFLTVEESSDFTSITDLADTYPGVPTFFIIPEESDLLNFNSWTGIKAQPWFHTGPTTENDDFPSTRFSKGDKVIGSIYNKNGVGAARFTSAEMVMNHAAGFSMAFATVGSFLAFSMF